EILALQSLVPRVPTADHVIDFAVRLVRASRPQESSIPEIRDYVTFGAGPRASQSLILAAKARAVLAGRYAAETDDVEAVAHPVFRHRLVKNFRADADRIDPAALIGALLTHIRP
ncbi:MAG: AAA family ATPase, partial [Myxococcales bacterium]|nr:AAA family ATPase [Myxococcales bacterium]